MSNSTKLSARDRIFNLLDENSFVEIGALITKRSTDFNLEETDAPSDGVVTGYGMIEGNLVYVYSQDSSVLNGTIGEMHAKKISGLYDFAMKVGAPVIGLIDCAGLRLQEATDALAGFGDVYFKQVKASGVIPQITAIFGNCGGGSAVSSQLGDFTFMLEKESALFVNSANTLDGNYKEKCDTTAAKFQAENGVCDFVCKDEADLFAKVRNLVSILPSNNEDYVAKDNVTDSLNRASEDFAKLSKDPAKALALISDGKKFVEVKAEYAKEMVTGFISLNGMTIGAVANRVELGKEKYDAVLTTNGCRKATDFINFCDAFDIPVLSLTNATGYRATMCEEKHIAVAAAKLTYAFASASVPKINVITGDAFGSAYIVMNSKHIGADMVFAVENAKIGMMNATLAAKILADGNDEQVAKIASEYDSLQQSATSAAKRGYVDAVIEEDTVRQNLCYAFDMLFAKRSGEATKKHGTV